MQTYVGLGSNLGDRAGYLRGGLDGLLAAGLAPLDRSAVWETEPVDTAEPGTFLNMAVRIDTARAPRDVLLRLLAVERQQGRTRGGLNAPRTLDLDLLCMGDLVVDEPGLTLPHPRMWQRRFVLEPLAEIAPDLRDPVSGLNVAEVCLRLRAFQQVRRLGDLAAL